MAIGERAASELETGRVDDKVEGGCRKRLKDRPTELEVQSGEVGSKEELSKQKDGLPGRMETGATVTEEDPLGEHAFWQLLERSGYTRC